jgi:hypothetical protein
MASTCYQSIADSYPYKSILNLDFQLPKPSAPSDAIALGCARFNLSPVNTPCLMHDRRFQGLPATGQSLSSDYTADPEEEAEISDSDDDDLPSIRKIIARSRSTIDLTLDDDDDDDNASDKNTIEVSRLRIIQTARYSVTLIPPLIDHIQLTDLLPSRPTILIAKVTRTYRRRPHNVVCSGYTC